MKYSTKEAIRCVALVALTAAEVVIAIYPLAKCIYNEKAAAEKSEKSLLSGYTEGFLASAALFGAACDAVVKLKKNL